MQISTQTRPLANRLQTPPRKADPQPPNDSYDLQGTVAGAGIGMMWGSLAAGVFGVPAAIGSTPWAHFLAGPAVGGAIGALIGFAQSDDIKNWSSNRAGKAAAQGAAVGSLVGIAASLIFHAGSNLPGAAGLLAPAAVGAVAFGMRNWGAGNTGD